MFQVAGQIAGIGGLSLVFFLAITKTVVSKTQGVNQQQSFHLLNKSLWFAVVVTVLGIAAWLISLAIASNQAVREKELEVEKHRISANGVDEQQVEAIRRELSEIKDAVTRLAKTEDPQLIPEVHHRIEDFVAAHGDVEELDSVRETFEQMRDRIARNPSLSTPYLDVFIYPVKLSSESWATVLDGEAIDAEDPRLIFVDPYQAESDLPAISVSTDSFEHVDPVVLELWPQPERSGEPLGLINLDPSGGEFFAELSKSKWDRLYMYLGPGIELECQVRFLYAG